MTLGKHLSNLERPALGSFTGQKWGSLTWLSGPADSHWPQQLAVRRQLARGPAVMSLVQSARMNGHDQYA